MHLHQTLLLRLAIVKVVLLHLKLLMDYQLSQTRLLRRCIPWLECFRAWNHRIFNSVRSRVCWPTLFHGSMLKAVRAASYPCLLPMLSYFGMWVCWYGFLVFIAYLMYPESIFVTYMCCSFFFLSLCAFSCLYFNYFAILWQKRENIEYLTHLKIKRGRTLSI